MTGPTGYIGSAVARAFIQGGHQVTGLVRSREKGEELAKMGGDPVRGDMKDPATYMSIAAEHDVLIHGGFEHGADPVAADRMAIETLLSAARKSRLPRMVIYTSGIMVLGNTGEAPADEEASTEGAAEAVAWRPAHEKLAVGAASDLVATAVIRPGMVYGGRGGLLSQFFASAVIGGAATYLGSGKNRWSLVHRNDLARLYCLVSEKRARGVFHGVDGMAIPVAGLAEAASLAAGKGGAVRSLPLEEARKQMGLFADALCLDMAVSAPRSEALGWTTSYPSFLESAPDAFKEWNTE